MPSKLSQFWQELKRRNVVRVITVYAGVAFVIIELINNITEPLRLPEWTPTLVIVLLAIGFPVVIIFSWIYDFHPEGGIVKSEPVHKVNPEVIPKSSNSWKIASYISFVVIVGLIILNILPRTSRQKVAEVLDKSIAVLPFKYLSNELDKQYLADGVMDEILLNLSKIESLRVISSTSVEQYRRTEKTATEICQELGISYLLEGSFLKNGEQVRLIVQLIEPGKEGHVWAKNYDRSWQDIFDVQSEVARLVARELQALIVPEEQQRIDNSPTTDLAAYEIYLKANTMRDEFINNLDHPSYKAAVGLYNMALERDSSFARAYAGLASVIYVRYASETYLDENYLDTVLSLANKALSFDDQLEEAYFIRARYFRRNGLIGESLSDLDKALEINPNYSAAYLAKGYYLIRNNKDYQQGIENYQKALTLIFGEERPSILSYLILAYEEIGMIDLARNVMEEKLALDGDSASLLDDRAWIELCLENFEEAYRYAKRAALIEGHEIIQMDYMNCLPSTYSDAYYENVLKLVEWYKEINQLPLQYAHRIGYGFYQVGEKEEANRYFKMQIQYGEESIKLGRSIAQMGAAQYDLAATYAFTGEKEKAYKYLSEFGRRDKYPLWWISLLKNDPLFNGIRNEPEFQRIQQNVEGKYQAEHERVRQWLEANNML